MFKYIFFSIFLSNLSSEKYFIKQFPNYGIKINYFPNYKEYQRFLNIFKSSEIKEFFKIETDKRSKETKILLSDLNPKEIFIIYKKTIKKELIPVFGAVGENGKFFFGHANRGKENFEDFRKLFIKKFKVI